MIARRFVTASRRRSVASTPVPTTSAVRPVQRGTAAVGSAASSGICTVTKPTGVVQGDLLVAFQAADVDSGVTSAGLTGPTDWTLEGAHANLSSIGFMKVWMKIAGASEGTSYGWDVNGSQSDQVVTLTAWQGGTFDPTDPLTNLTFSGSASSSTNADAPSIAGIADGILLTAHAPMTGSTSRAAAPTGMSAQGSGSSSSWTYLNGYSLLLASTDPTGTKRQTLTTARGSINASVIVQPHPGA